MFGSLSKQVTIEVKDNKQKRELLGSVKKQITLNMTESKKSRMEAKAQQTTGSSVEMGLFEGLNHADKKLKK